ncbi:MFS transporter [Mycolicibacterium pallens]|uniref:MFS transporter n=1 Tax=Mycolicibacterium pallens TaxID=370524 RepID=A0ABX8VK12_9MYCO|nr:MFS transporter [Mycolicibacterium pallens]APE16405.1 MFS transporter [Mycobacterium sp. WY10]QYL18144.1 MFS transporter [Mycolicibacterium pallens]
MSPTRRGLPFALLAYAFAAIMVGTTLPTPLYALYSDQMHFAVLTTTVIYATYAGGVLFALMVFGRWSDAIGRRPVLLAGVGCALISAGVFLVADSVPELLVGRVLSGLSAGIFTGTATAAVIEAAPPSWKTRAAAVATIANIGGLGTGPVLAGVLAQYAPNPLKLTYIVHIALMVLAAVAILLVPETSSRTGKLGLQRLSVPPEVRSVFITAALAAFAGFAVTGLFTSVAPSLLTNIIGIGNHALAGVMAGSIFGASAVAQIAGTRIPPQRAVALGCAILTVGMGILVVALHYSSLAGLIIAAVVAGIGQGISFSRGLAAVAERTPAERRAEVSSTYFVVAYIAISIPVIGEGFAAQAWGLRTGGTVFAIAVGVLALVCLTAILRQESRPAAELSEHAAG